MVPMAARERAAQRAHTTRRGMYYCRGGGHVPRGGRVGQGAVLSLVGVAETDRRRACAREQRTAQWSMCGVGSPWADSSADGQATGQAHAAGPSPALCVLYVLFLPSVLTECMPMRCRAGGMSVAPVCAYAAAPPPRQ